MSVSQVIGSLFEEALGKKGSGAEIPGRKGHSYRNIGDMLRWWQVDQRNGVDTSIGGQWKMNLER